MATQPAPTENTTKTSPEPSKIEAEMKQVVAESKSWLHFSSKLVDPEHPIRQEILFILIVILAVVSVAWGWAHGLNLHKAGLNPNLFHESLGTILAVLSVIWSYFNLYRTSDSFVADQEAKEAAEEAAEEAKRQADQARKDKAFSKIVVGFESCKTFEERTRIMGDLLAVGIESPSLRQRVVDALKTMNDWMVDSEIFLQDQNLVSWRLKNQLFEISSRFQENTETQDASIKIINILEAIVRKHVEEFIAGHNTTTLDLSGHCLPTLNLSAKQIPPKCLKMVNGFFWQSSFSESTLTDLSFAGSNFYGSSFWRATLNNIDFQDVTLKRGKLRTNLQNVKNLSREEFFLTKEWDLCLLSRAQEIEFFGEVPSEQDAHYNKWNSSKIRRDKLYFGIDKI